MSHARRSFVRKTGGALIAVGLGLCLLELGVRIVSKVTLRERGHAFDRDVGWRPLPNIEKRNAFWGTEREPAFTNTHGLRDGEHDYERPHGTKRVVVLGDSFTFGVGVDYGQRFTELLEQDGLELINLGVNAYGTDQEVRRYEVDGVRYEADLVLLVTFLGNDLEDIAYERRAGAARPHFELEEDELVFVPARADATTWLRQKSYVVELLMRLAERPDDTPVAAWEGRDTLPLYLALVERLERAVRANGGELCVVLAYPSWRWRYPSDLRVGKALEARGIDVLDTHEAFLEDGRPNQALYLPDTHWTPAGHVVLAGLLENVLKERGLLD